MASFGVSGESKKQVSFCPAVVSLRDFQIYGTTVFNLVYLGFDRLFGEQLNVTL